MMVDAWYCLLHDVVGTQVPAAYLFVKQKFRQLGAALDVLLRQRNGPPVSDSDSDSSDGSDGDDAGGGGGGGRGGGRARPAAPRLPTAISISTRWEDDDEEEGTVEAVNRDFHNASQRDLLRATTQLDLGVSV